MPRRKENDEYEWAYAPDLYAHPIPIGHIRRLTLKLVLRTLLALADVFDLLFTQAKTRDTAR